MRLERPFWCPGVVLEATGGGHKEVRKAIGNVVGIRPDFKMGRARPEGDVTQAVGGLPLGF